MARSANEEHHHQPHWADCGAIRDCVAGCMRNRETAHALITPARISAGLNGRTVAPNLPRADSINLSATANAIRAFHAVQICTESRPAFGVQEMSRLGIPAA
jgi:hypothetical protein